MFVCTFAIQGTSERKVPVRAYILVLATAMTSIQQLRENPIFKRKFGNFNTLIK